MCPCIHQPLGIAKHGNTEIGQIKLQAVDLGKGYPQFGRTGRVEDHNIGFVLTERLGKGIFARLQVGHAILNVPSFQLSAECKRKDTFLAR